MPLSPLAGKPAPASILINVDALLRAYETRKPDLADPAQRVSFGTSGHRGSPLNGSFNDAHIAAITQAICEYRGSQSITGPLFMGIDTHAVSVPALRTALEVLAANAVETVIQEGGEFTPTPVISYSILVHNRGRTAGLADGIVVTPSHNPPADGGFKYNPPNGGPADTDVTDWVQNRANALLAADNREVKRISYERAMKSPTTHARDLMMPYVNDLGQVVDLEAIKAAKVRIGIDPLGGAAAHYWGPIRERYGIDVTVVNPRIDPTFGFMTVDHDGQIRMDCSSPYAMASLIGMKDRFQVACGNDADSDRHGIVTPSLGLMNPNYFLAVAIRYLFTHRPKWGGHVGIGKTLVSSGLIDRVAGALGRKLVEVPVGFKWFTPGLFDGTLGFGGEESAGLSFLRRDGSVWTTDKDGPIADLLAAEIIAKTGKDPGEHYRELAAQFGTSHYRRIDAAASSAQKAVLKKLAPEQVQETMLAGEPITARLTRAPGNNAPIGGLKVVTESGWFAARPSGTEDVYKIYAESFQDEAHLDRIIAEAQQIVSAAFATAGTK